MTPDDLISDAYRAANRALHEAPEGFGGSGWKHWTRVCIFADELGAKEVLDYGCGEGTLRRQLFKAGSALRVREYDPGIPKKARLPQPCDLVVCTDVLEHVEPDKIDNVLSHLCSLTRKGCYLVIATRPANKKLPDGRNAHLIIEDTPWWCERVARHPWLLARVEDIRKGGVPTGGPHEVRMWLRVAENAQEGSG